jgi:hypothetical protein
MQTVTLGYVIDNLQEDEVAVKIDGVFGEVPNTTQEYVDTAIVIGRDGFLSSIDGRRINGIHMIVRDVKADEYFILKRDIFDDLMKRFG